MTSLSPNPPTPASTWEVEIANVTNITTYYDVYGELLTANNTNGTTPYDPPYAIWQATCICIICTVLTIGTILGNALVCLAVGIVKKLRTATNLLIVSLAVSDFFVGLIVMPFALVYEIRGQWDFGQDFCLTWTSLDIVMCTASILNLCAISLDRYFVITRPFKYVMKRKPSLMAGIIAGVWIASVLISIPPVIGWQTEPVLGQCVISQEPGYQFYATICAFYLPLSVMIFVYYRIYMLSSKIAQAEAHSKPTGESRCHSEVVTPLRKPSDQVNHNITYPNGEIDEDKFNATFEKNQKKKRSRFNFFKKSRLNRISSSKDRKATKTLGVIMGAFTACWLPFFILALVRPFAGDAIPYWLTSLCQWVGYANSFLNPIIYARFNRDFRQPFKEIIMCRCKDINNRRRSENYAEQFGGRGPAQTAHRDCLRPPVDTVVRYNSQGQTIVKLGNGDTVKDAPTHDNGAN